MHADHMHTIRRQYTQAADHRAQSTERARLSRYNGGCDPDRADLHRAVPGSTGNHTADHTADDLNKTGKTLQLRRMQNVIPHRKGA